MQANGMIFWDWNGTLMDDVDFTHSCLNWMLETHGYPQRYDLAAYREISGAGGRACFPPPAGTT